MYLHRVIVHSCQFLLSSSCLCGARLHSISFKLLQYRYLIYINIPKMADTFNLNTLSSCCLKSWPPFNLALQIRTVNEICLWHGLAWFGTNTCILYIINNDYIIILHAEYWIIKLVCWLSLLKSRSVDYDYFCQWQFIHLFIFFFLLLNISVLFFVVVPVISLKRIASWQMCYETNYALILFSFAHCITRFYGSTRRSWTGCFCAIWFVLHVEKMITNLFSSFSQSVCVLSV